MKTDTEEIVELKKQIKEIIAILKIRMESNSDSLILKTLYGRYTRAETILSGNGDIDKIMISGGCRAYLDAFSDYSNPLLVEMEKAENMVSNIKKGI